MVIIEQLLSADWSEKTGKTGAKKGWWGRKGKGMITESDERVRGLEEERIEVPSPKPEDDCVECYAWEFGAYLNKTNRR